MTKIYYILTFLVLAVQTSSAQDCEFKKNEVDEFTNEIIKITEASVIDIPLMGGASSKLNFIRKNENFSIWFYYSNSTLAESISVMENDTMMIKLEDNEIIKLPPTGSFEMKTQVINGIVIKSITPTYSINKSQLETLSQSKIEKVRFYFNQKKIDHDIKAKNARKIMSAAACIIL